MCAVFSFILLVISMNVSALSPHPVKSDESDYRAILTLATGSVEKHLGKPATLDVHQLQTLEDWAFLRAQMTTPAGKPISYEGTEYADSAVVGGVSSTYVALLKRDRGVWKVVVDRVGPTDVIWETWSKDYGAPEALFESP